MYYLNFAKAFLRAVNASADRIESIESIGSLNLRTLGENALISTYCTVLGHFKKCM